MSVIRRKSGSRFMPAIVLLSVLLPAGGQLASAAGDQAMLTGTPSAPAKPTPVSTDATTGYAISGFDPVSYFTERRPRPGTGTQELRWNEAAWRFANSGNLDAFKRHPETYAPRFGGFGAVSLARGRLVDSDPEVFRLHRGRLYLFYSPQQAIVFDEAPDDFVAQAETAWRRINRMPDLPPPPKPVEKAASKDRPGIDIFD